MTTRRARPGWVATALAAALVAAALGQSPASGADLETLREQAQSVAAQVTGLEHRLAGLDGRKAVLESAISKSERELALLELEIHDAEAATRIANRRLVQRAVALYKSGPGTQLGLLLSAQSLGDLVTAGEVAAGVARSDRAALDDFLAAEREAVTKQQQVDNRKQALLVRRAALEGVRSAVVDTLTVRKRLLRQLTDQIAEFEARARAAAAQAAQPAQALLGLLQPSGPAPDIPEGFASTGVAFEGIASWYGPGFEGNPTASGDIFDPGLFTAASLDLPLGTWLHVSHQGRGVVVLVNDRGPYIDGRVLDLSQAAAQAIGITGLGWVRAEIIVKT